MIVEEKSRKTLQEQHTGLILQQKNPFLQSTETNIQIKDGTMNNGADFD